MAYQPEIVPSSAQGQALQAAIQKQLAFLGWTTDDDNVMAEYCLVMLGNRKTPEQISTELSDLIGSDFDESFVHWLFTELKQHYPEPVAAAAPSAPTSPNTASTSTSTTNSNSNNNTSLPTRPIGIRGANNRGGGGGSAVFGNALTGVKRDSREIDGNSTNGRDSQRQRFDGVPSGPRNGNGPRANGAGARNLKDRMGPSQARNNPMPMQAGNTMGMPPQAYEAIAQTINAVKRGAHPSALAGIPFPALASHPLASTLPPQIMAQAQAAAMAQAQAFAAMSNVWNGAAPTPFNPQAQTFNPAFGQAPPQQQHAAQFQNPSQAPPQPKAPAPVVLPTKPTDEAICKHGVDCTKPQCPYSHPSPVATKESGLVLSSEPCEKQINCQDKDCPKSHVSPAQKNSPPSKTTTNFAGQTTFVPPPTVRAVPVADPSSIPGAGQKPCKFAGACTRPGCVFLHPWDAAAGGSNPCRYGAACTRADCHFSHPPGRRFPGSHPSPAGGGRNLSATFNKPVASASAAGTKEGSIGAWPKEEDGHVSERLKRFAMDGNNTATEKIIPGQATKEEEKKVDLGIVGTDGEKKEIAPAA